MSELPSESVATNKRGAWKRPATVVALLALTVGAAAGWLRTPPRPFLTPGTVEVVEVQPRPNVVAAVRDLKQLTTAEQDIERVMDIRSKQSHMFGLLNAEDALLLVAAGTVTAGIDLSELNDSDVEVEWEKRTVRMHLPAPHILATRLDNRRTYVHSRSTDLLAKRSESLEGEARKQAESEIEQAARDAGLLPRASANAARTMEALLHGLGFEHVSVIVTES